MHNSHPLQSSRFISMVPFALVSAIDYSSNSIFVTEDVLRLYAQIRIRASF